MIVGCYSLHLYCDFPDDSYAHRGSGEHPGPGFGDFSGETGGAARNRARRAGWLLESGLTRALCPSCIKQGRQLLK